MATQNGKAAIWLKLGLGIVAILVVGILIIGIIIANIFNQALDPQKAKNILHEIVEIDEPLPTGWQYCAGSFLEGEHKKTVLLKYSDGTMVFIIEKPNPNKKTAKELAVLPSKSESKNTWLKDVSNEILIGGTKGYFIKDHCNSNAEERIYVVMPNNRYVEIQTVVHGFDTSRSQSLLKSIKGFK